MTIFASYLELIDKFSTYGKRADLSEKGAEMTTFAVYKYCLNTQRNKTNNFSSFF